jgi:hypothetical protein
LRSLQPAVELFLDEARILQQPDNLVPDDVIEKVLANRSTAADCAV